MKDYFFIIDKGNERNNNDYIATITLPKEKYEKLKRQAEAYRRFAAQFFEMAVKDPIKEVVDDFRKTGLYSGGFLKDLEAGLRKSSYVKRYGNKTARAGSRKVS